MGRSNNRVDVRDYQSKHPRKNHRQVNRQQEIQEITDGRGCVGVINRNGESIDKMLNRFKKKIKNSELLIKYNYSRFYKKPSFIKRLKNQESKRLQRKRDRINDDFNKI